MGQRSLGLGACRGLGYGQSAGVQSDLARNVHQAPVLNSKAILTT